eukprot:TRINITY_DN1810_c0_g1_i1.p1 TRINITY_DN1810_c0_g1~~TRINITY_DN1810_c0_g1_i1.p1  ORF type:complete len:133 (-),score=2.84 TRINITY_DN1810_c0_g1_i1:30-428(-)
MITNKNYKYFFFLKERFNSHQMLKKENINGYFFQSQTSAQSFAAQILQEKDWLELYQLFVVGMQFLEMQLKIVKLFFCLENGVSVLVIMIRRGSLESVQQFEMILILLVHLQSCMLVALCKILKRNHTRCQQ